MCWTSFVVLSWAASLISHVSMTSSGMKRCEQSGSRRFNCRGGAVKHVHSCLSGSKDWQSSFHHCGNPVKLVQACLCVGSTLQWRFHRRGGAVRHVQACLSARKDGESSFTTVEIEWSWWKSVYLRYTPYNALLTAEVVLWSTCSPVYAPEKMEKAVFTTVEILWSRCKPV